MSDQVLSVISAVNPQRADFLMDAYDSLCQQELPPGWTWKWLVQQDGGDYPLSVPDDPRISFSHGRKGGPNTARTMALARVEGELVKNLDSDDVLMPGVLHRDIRELTKRSAISWTTSPCIDLHLDGSTAEFPPSLPPGMVFYDELFRAWLRTGRMPVHPATLCVRVPLLLMLGGWPALSSSGDTALMLGLNVISCGWLHDLPGMLYRHWPGQMRAESVCQEEINARRRVSIRRTLALRAWLRPDAPALLPDAELSVVQ